MDLTNMTVKEAFASYLGELMLENGMTVQALAHKSGFSDRHINNYLNPKQEIDNETGVTKEVPAAISAKFYNTMQTTLNFQHQDFQNYFANLETKTSAHAVKNINIKDSTLTNTVFGISGDVHFHSKSDN